MIDRQAVRRCRGLVLMLLWVPSALLQAQSPRARIGQERLDSLLLDQATRLLERFGDTFYVLGLYVGPGGEVLGISTRNWAALNAPPDEWRDSLEAALREYLPNVRTAAYVVDRWRQLDSTRADSTYAVFHFESAAGFCLETRRRYEWSAAGPVVWTKPDTIPCTPRIWRGRSAKPN
jgi:hypothetical protein